jgi:hypothetical protein
MVAYDVPEDLTVEETALADLPDGWTRDAVLTRRLGDDWLAAKRAPLMKVPSVVLPVRDSPDTNILINHGNAEAARIGVRSISDFRLDARLLG